MPITTEQGGTKLDKTWNSQTDYLYFRMREIKAIFLQLKDRNFFQMSESRKNNLYKSHIFSLDTSDETSPSNKTNKCRQQMYANGVEPFKM